MSSTYASFFAAAVVGIVIFYTTCFTPVIEIDNEIQARIERIRELEERRRREEESECKESVDMGKHDHNAEDVKAAITRKQESTEEKQVELSRNASIEKQQDVCNEVFLKATSSAAGGIEEEKRIERIREPDQLCRRCEKESECKESVDMKNEDQDTEKVYNTLVICK